MVDFEPLEQFSEALEIHRADRSNNGGRPKAHVGRCARNGDEASKHPAAELMYIILLLKLRFLHPLLVPKRIGVLVAQKYLTASSR